MVSMCVFDQQELLYRKPGVYIFYFTVLGIEQPKLKNVRWKPKVHPQNTSIESYQEKS